MNKVFGILMAILAVVHFYAAVCASKYLSTMPRGYFIRRKDSEESFLLACTILPIMAGLMWAAMAARELWPKRTEQL